MKQWEKASIVELNINETAQGGRNLKKVDNLWTDTKTNDLYASYASGGEQTGDPIDVTKPAL